MFNIEDLASKLLTEVYKDTVQPAVKEGGSTLGRSVRALLSPARDLLWGWKKIEEIIVAGISRRIVCRSFLLCFLLCCSMFGISLCMAAPSEKPENIKVIRCPIEGFFLPQISGMADHRLEGKINRELRGMISYYNRPEQYGSLSGDFEVTFYNGNLLGIHFIGASYNRRSAHPDKIDFGIQIDLTTGVRYELSDLFKEGVDYEGRIKELCRINEAGYRLTNKDVCNWTWDGWSYPEFARLWEGDRFLLSADSIRVYDSLNYATGYFSGYRVPLADLVDIINTDGRMWKALKSREPMNIHVELEPLDIGDFFLREYDIKPGDDASWATTIMGEPKSKTPVQEGVRYEYDDLEIIVGPQGKVVNIIADKKDVSTRRWVHPGSLIKTVKARYGDEAVVSSYGEYDFYEYIFHRNIDNLRPTYILRFAVKQGTDTVSYIGWRISEP